MLAEVVLSSSPSSQLAVGFPRCHARPRMRDSNEIMPALVFKYENAHIEFLIAHTIGFRDYSKWAGWIDSADPRLSEPYVSRLCVRRAARAGATNPKSQRPARRIPGSGRGTARPQAESRPSPVPHQ